MVDARSCNCASHCQAITPTECLCVTPVMNLAIYRNMMSMHFVCRVIECKGPTNTRVYTVAVYFRGERLAKASGHSIQQAEMNAAKEALELSQGLCIGMQRFLKYLLAISIFCSSEKYGYLCAGTSLRLSAPHIAKINP